MSDNSANPETGAVVDMESAVASLIAQEEPDTETEETEAPQEAQSEDEAQAEDEDTAETEAEEDTDESEDSDDADEDDEEPDPVYTVKVNGQEFEVNLEELRAGYQKGADYQQKTAELAEQRRALEAEKQQSSQLRDLLANELAKVARPEEQEPDWLKLSKELDPWEYQQKQAEWANTQSARRQAAQQAEYLRTQRHAEAIHANGPKLLESFPEWKGNQARFEQDREAMRTAARDYGFSDDEFMGAVDYRAFVMLRDAMEGRKLRAAKTATAKKVPKKATKVLKPGAAETSASRTAKEKVSRLDKLRKRGDVDSAVEYLLGG